MHLDINPLCKSCLFFFKDKCWKNHAVNYPDGTACGDYRQLNQEELEEIMAQDGDEQDE